MPELSLDPALALLEFDSIAVGMAAGDAMVKRAPVTRIQTGTVQPGHFLVMVAGSVADVGETVAVGRELGGGSLLDLVFLPQIHPDVVDSVAGVRRARRGEAVGIIETYTVARSIHVADAALKGAEVDLIQLRLADGLGGRGLVIFAGHVADVEAAVDIGVAIAADQLLRQVVISQMHDEMWANVTGAGRFRDHFNWGSAGDAPGQGS